jgi:GDPmannose 4,6-dehydratase
MRALITGITGQDGSYLAELLLSLGAEVFGLVRRTSDPKLTRIAHLVPRLHLLDGDVLDQASLVRALATARPDEVYHLAAQSFVGRSWAEPVHTAEVTGLGALRMLEALRIAAPEARFYQASSSEMYGNARPPVAADGPFHPRSPYGTAKLFAHSSAVNFRESFGLHVSCGILFNHESPRRGAEFVTRKVAIAASRAAQGDHEKLLLGNLDARRDWGWAPDYVQAMHRILQEDRPGDWVIGTGRSHSVRDLCAAAYGAVGLDWEAFVRVDPKLVRPAEIDALVADPSPAAERLGWRPSVTFEGMVERMVRAELDSAA